MAALAALLAALLLVSLTLGRYGIPVGQLLQIFFGKLTGAEPTWPATVERVLFSVRLPRILCAMMVGAALSGSGAAYQGIFKNPMVSPDILGASAGAGFGAALAILNNFNLLGIELTSFAFGLTAVLLTCGLSRSIGRRMNAVLVLVLTGMLRQMLLEMGAQPLCLPIVRDVPGQMAEVLEEALHRADIVVVNAGSSKGEEDFSTRLLRGTDTFLFHGVRAVPGRPLSIAVAQGKPVVNLPGPPMAAFNGADWCLRAVVASFLHTAPDEPRSVQAVLTAPLDGPKALRFTSRMEVYRSEGTVYARPVPREEGSTARTMAANGYYASPVGEGRLESGDVIRVSLLRGIEER